MQHLLVPTDFSECARQALNYAVTLANAFGSEIILYHVFKMRITSRSFISIDALLKEEAEEKMATVIEEVRPVLKSGARIRGLARKGEITTAIAQRAREEKADLLIMGTEGSSRLQGLLFGSTTTGVIEYTDCPLLAVPKGAAPPSFQKLLLALDSRGVKHPQTLRPLLAIAKAFNTQLRIYHKANPDHPVEMEEIISHLLPDTPHQLHYETSSQNTIDSIIAYAKKEEANLLCLIRRKRDFLEGLLHTSVTRENLLHSDIPMLILRDDGGHGGH